MVYQLQLYIAAVLKVLNHFYADICFLRQFGDTLADKNLREATL